MQLTLTRVQTNVVEPLLLSTTLVTTWSGDQNLTSATGFFFESDETLFLITSRHAVLDETSDHRPGRVEFWVHTDHKNLAAYSTISTALYASRKSTWREMTDAGGLIDIAAIPIDRSTLPHSYFLYPFNQRHIPETWDNIIPGSVAATVGFPMGFHDALHKLPVVRQSSIASAVGLRFQGQGYFLTDARTHSGSSGSPVLLFHGDGNNATSDIPWLLLGVHSSRFDMGSRDVEIDEALGLNCCWYADALVHLTA